MSKEEIQALAEQLGTTEEGVAELIRQARAAEGPSREVKEAVEAQRSELAAALEDARAGDFDALGRLAATQLADSQYQATVDAESQTVVDGKLRAFVEARYGDQIKALKPEEVAKLDSMELADALALLDDQRAKSQGTGAEPLTGLDKARAIAARKMEIRQDEQEEDAALHESIMEQINRGTEEAAGPEVVEEEFVEEAQA